MFQIRSETDENFRNIHQETLNNYHANHSIWREVEDFWFNYHSKLIESKKNLGNLATLLNLNNNDAGLRQCKIWLNNYLQFLKENYTKVESRKIFPNQIGNFEKLNNLRYDESIPELLKDIYNDLKSTANERYEIRKKLLLKEITCYNTYYNFTQREIIGEINESFQNSQEDNTKINISEKILSILPNNNTEYFSKISEALSEFIPYYNIIFNKNLNQQKETVSTKLNYEIFLRYLLIRTLESIENMSENPIPEEKIYIISKIIKLLGKIKITD